MAQFKQDQNILVSPRSIPSHGGPVEGAGLCLSKLLSSLLCDWPTCVPKFPSPWLAQTPSPTLAVVPCRQGFVVGFRPAVAARAPPPISGPASLPRRPVLLAVRHVALATRSMATDVYSTVTTSCNTVTNGRAWLAAQQRQHKRKNLKS